MTGRRSNNQLSKRDLRALRYIRRMIRASGRGPSTREVARHLGRSSSRTGAIAIQRLIDAGFLRRREDKSLQLIREIPEGPAVHETIPVPLVGSVPCGTPLLAEENVEAIIPVSTRLARPPHRYFLLRAHGDSMSAAGIQDRDLVLVRKQSSAETGERVVALIDDEATIKEFHHTGSAVVLRPRSTNPQAHAPIVVTDDFSVQGVVVAAIGEVANDEHGI